MRRFAIKSFLVLAMFLTVIAGTSSSALAGVTVYLNGIDPVAVGSGGYNYGGGYNNYYGFKSTSAKINGKTYSSSLKGAAHSGDEKGAEYNLGRRYDNFKGAVGISDDAPKSETQAQFRVFGDDELLYESPIKKLGDEPSTFDISVKNVLRLKIVAVWVEGSKLDYAIWGNPYLTGPKIVEMTIGDIKYRSNDTELEMDIAPYVKSGRTYLPVRYVAEALGATVFWNNKTKTATVAGANGTVLTLTIGSRIMRNSNSNVQMDAAPEIRAGRTMLPIRWVAEALGATVDWNQEAKLVTIKLP